MVVNDLLKVLYAPHRAFNDIVKKPRYLGPLLILIIFVVAQVGSAYVVASKSLVEQTMPAGDQADSWTENAALWQSNPGVTVTNNHVDFINSTGYFNNTSIEFTADNASTVQMRLNDLGGSVNCGADGFKSLSVRVKVVSPDTQPVNVTVYLYTLSESNFFYYDLTQAFSNTTILEQNLWNNITIPVGSGDWSSSNSAANWENITALRMDFTWPSSSNIDIRVDAFFFRGIFTGFLDAFGSSVFISSALNAVTPFLFQWLLLTGLMYLLIKGLRGSTGWKPLMIAVGFALITFVIQAIVLAVAFTQLWPIERYPLEVLANVPGEYDAAAQVILNGRVQANQAGSIVQVAVYVWTIALGAFITRAVTSGTGIVAKTDAETSSPDVRVAFPQQFGWLKSLLVSAASFLLSILIMGFILGV